MKTAVRVILGLSTCVCLLAGLRHDVFAQETKKQFEAEEAEIKELLNSFQENPKLIELLEREGIVVGISLEEAKTRFGLTTELNDSDSSRLIYFNPQRYRKDGSTFGIEYCPVEKGIYQGLFYTDRNRLKGLHECLGVIRGNEKVDPVELAQAFSQKYPGGELFAFQGGRTLVTYSIRRQDTYLRISFEVDFYVNCKRSWVTDFSVYEADIQKEIQEIREKYAKEREKQNEVDNLKDSF